jgi:response regulator RpfG family c-di-GMP phosphodiesterase
MSVRILCVDDEPNILSGYRRSLRGQFEIETAGGGAEALQKMEKDGPYAVLVTDMRMPGMDGVQLLQEARRAWPDTVRVMLTGNADQQTATDAVNEGHIFRFLNKPCAPEDLARALTAGLAQYRLVTAEKELLEKTLGGTIRMLMELLASVDPELFERAQTLRRNMRTLAAAQVAGGCLSREELWPLELAALLARIGSVTVPPFVAAKVRQGEPLTEAEGEMWQRVPETSYALLRNIPRLEPVAEIVRSQHKHYAGGGVPEGTLAGEGIPRGARMLKVLLDLSDIEARNVSRAGAFTLMLRQAGRYDPQILAAARRCLAEDEQTAPETPSVSIPLGKLAPGHVLAEDIRTTDGKVLLTAGRRLTDVLLERLHNYAAVISIQEPICVRVTR